MVILAYKRGRPVERNVNLNADVKDFAAMIDELTAQSPAFQANRASGAFVVLVGTHVSSIDVPGRPDICRKRVVGV